MEINKLVSGGIILVLLFVVVPFVIIQVYQNTEQINDLFNEVFDFSYKKMLGDIEERDKDISLKIFKEIKDAYTKGKSEKWKDCVYDFNAYGMPTKYKIVLDGETIILYDDDERILKHDNLDADICIIESKDSYIGVKDNKIIFSYDLGLRVNGDKFREGHPKLYMNSTGNICVVYPRSGYLNDFSNSLKCGTNEKYSEDSMIALFRDFVFKFRSCLDNNITNCRCSQVDLRNELYEDYSIVSFPNKEEGVMFHLTFKGKSLMTEEFNYDFGEIKLSWWDKIKDISGLSASITPIDIDSFENINKELNYFEGYFVRLKGYIPSGKYYDGVFLSRVLPSDLVACSGWDEVYDKSCKRDLQFKMIYDRIEDEGYIEFIQNNIEDKEQQLRIMAIIATESEGKWNVISKTGAVGLMQFEHDTAKDYSNYFKKLVYACHTKRKRGEKCDEFNDDRFDPEKSILAGDKCIKDKIKYFEGICKDSKGNSVFSHKDIFGVAAYNGGQGTLCNAIKSTGNINPSWDDVRKEFRKVAVSKGKAEEIKCYPYYFKRYYDDFNSRLINDSVGYTERKTEGEDYYAGPCNDLDGDFDKCCEYLNQCVPIRISPLAGSIVCDPCSNYNYNSRTGIDCTTIRFEKVCNSPSLCKVPLNCEWLGPLCVDKDKFCNYLSESECYENFDRCFPSFKPVPTLILGGIQGLSNIYESCKSCKDWDDELLECSSFSQNFCEEYGQSNICGNKKLNCKWNLALYGEFWGICEKIK